MKLIKIIIGNHYRHKNTPCYCWAKVLEIVKPHTGVNTHGYPIAKCEWALEKNALFGLIKYFKVSDLIEDWENSMIDEQKHWTNLLSRKDLEHLLDNHIFSEASFIMSRKYHQTYIHGNTDTCSHCHEIAIKLKLDHHG